MPKKLGVFLLSYKRPDYVQEAINSILTQDYDDFELIISENTSDDTVEKQLHEYLADSRVQLIRRTPSLASLELFNRILAEAGKYEYVMLFHDDDSLVPQALSKMMQTLESNAQAAAVACNASIIKNSEPTNNLLSPNIKTNIEIKDQPQLINRYIFKNLSHIKLIKNGPFLWLAEPLMKYRQHSSNDSINLNMRDIFSLSLYFFKTSPSMILKIIFYFSKQLIKKLFF